MTEVPEEEVLLHQEDSGLDAASRDAIAARGLELRLIPLLDDPSVQEVSASAGDASENPPPPAESVTRQSIDNWFRSITRGFLEDEPEQKTLDAMLARSKSRRNIGVFDATTPQAEIPIATYGSFLSELTVPGGNTLLTFAVTGVTVAATHRRRGLARQMMEGELRRAAAAGVPVAALTASEASIYQRYGFAPAANGATWVFDRKRARFAGAETDGRVDYIAREQFLELIPAFHDRVRHASPGEIVPARGYWATVAGLAADSTDGNANRFVQYLDAHGDVQGLAVYVIHSNAEDYTKNGLSIQTMLTATDDSYAALWRYFFEHDLIGKITADLRSVDEPVRWMIEDQRAATVTVRDHQYVRILDVKQALEARSYAASGRVVFDVIDPLGIDAGRFALEVDDDGARVARDVTDEAEATLTTVELSALLLGGTSAQTLVSAGRITAARPEVIDAMFRTPIEPRLSFWY